MNTLTLNCTFRVVKNESAYCLWSGIYELARELGSFHGEFSNLLNSDLGAGRGLQTHASLLPPAPTLGDDWETFAAHLCNGATPGFLKKSSRETRRWHFDSPKRLIQ